MSYIPVPEQIEDDIWTATNMNIFVRDNFAMNIPALFTDRGDMAVGLGIDDVTRLASGNHGQVLMSGSGTYSGLEWVNRVLRRVGGSAVDWDIAGTSDYDPGMILIQCGTRNWTGTATSGGTINQTFPVDFSAAPIVLITPINVTGTSGMILVNGIGNFTNLSIIWRAVSGSYIPSFMWMAIGKP